MEYTYLTIELPNGWADDTAAAVEKMRLLDPKEAAFNCYAFENWRCGSVRIADADYKHVLLRDFVIEQLEALKNDPSLVCVEECNYDSSRWATGGAVHDGAEDNPTPAYTHVTALLDCTWGLKERDFDNTIGLAREGDVDYRIRGTNTVWVGADTPAGKIAISIATGGDGVNINLWREDEIDTLYPRGNLGMVWADLEAGQWKEL